MKKTVEELIDMIDANKLHTDHTTQRSFLYNDIVNEYGVSKSGELLYSMLVKDIKLPSIYFWQTKGDPEIDDYADDEYNIHDGKQRLLSIYYFVKGNVSMCMNLDEVKKGKEDPISKTMSDLVRINHPFVAKLLDYEFEIIVNSGTRAEEEYSFFTLNQSVLPLTDYETLRGCYYGNFIEKFESHINNSKYDKVPKVGRGETAIWFLHMYFPYAKTSNKTEMMNNLRVELTKIRNKEFVAIDNQYDEKLKFYNEFSRALNSIGRADRTDGHGMLLKVKLIDYVFSNKLNCKAICEYINSAKVESGGTLENDMNKWSYSEWVTAIDSVCKEPKIVRVVNTSEGKVTRVGVDYLRFFPNHMKSEIYNRDAHVCKGCGNDLPYYMAEVDHIKAWSKGGNTTVDNGQLMCKSCNSKKGAKNE